MLKHLGASFLIPIVTLATPIQRDIPIYKALNLYQEEKIISILKKEKYNSYSTQHFIIYYGDNYPQNDLWADKNNNGIPYFVEKTGQILEYVWQKEVENLNLGYPYGGTPIRVYIANTGITLNGQDLKLPDTVCGFATIYNGESFIVINDNPPSDGFTSALDMLKITLAHEFFHLIQFSYKISSKKEDTFLYEGTAVLMEKTVYPNIKDYIYSYAGELYLNPEKGLVYPEALHPYSTVLFFDYLEHRFGFDIIKEIWENFENSSNALEAIAKTLQQEGSSFVSELYNFYVDMSTNLNYFDNKKILQKIKNTYLSKITKINQSVKVKIFPTGSIFYTNEVENLFINNLGKKHLLIWSDNFSNATWINISNNSLNDHLIVDYSKDDLLKPRPIVLFLSSINNFYLKLNKGWNLKTVPKTVNSTIFNKAKITSVWKWDGTQWKVYIPNDKPTLKNLVKKYKIKEFTSIKPSEGIWIKTNDSFKLSLSSDKFNVSLNATNKWNLVGNPSPAQLDLKLLSKIYDFQIVWYWDSKQNKWKVFVPDKEKQLKNLVKKYGIETIDYIPENSFQGFWLKRN